MATYCNGGQFISILQVICGVFISILKFLCGHFLSSILPYVYSSYFKVDIFSILLAQTKRWTIYLYSTSYMWRVYLYFKILMWALSLQHPTLCLSIILQSGYFFSILPYHNIGGWFFSILCLICGKFFSIILDEMSHVILKLSWLLFLFFNQIIKSGQFFPVS